MKKELLAGGALANILFLTACGTKNPERPNIVFIMCDDHSFQTISAYGHPISQLAPTPNIDRLARSGMRFERAYVENSLSTPSRACLMTGLYSHQNGQRRLGKGIDSSKTFFSELLRQAGYQTGVVGKWHMQCEPKGFDYFCLLNDQGEYYNPVFRTPESDGKFIREEGYSAALITDHSIEFLEKRDKTKPFCLLVHHKAPHRNWMPEEKYLTLYEDTTFPLPATFRDTYDSRGDAAGSQEMSISRDMTFIYDLKMLGLKETAPYDREWNIAGLEQELERMTPEQRRAWTKAYAAREEKFERENPQGDERAVWKYQQYLKDYLRCIKSVDDQVGRLLDYLEREGLRENTVIVYTSDQGFYMGEHGWFDKRFMYEESFRTPLIIAYDGRIAPGTVCDALVQNIDYAPTFLDLAGIAKPQEMSGRSLVSLFGGEIPDDWRRYLYYHYYDYPAIHQARRHDGVRDDRYKLVHFYGQGFGKDRGKDLDYDELYDLQNDPEELHNLIENPKYASTADRLRQELQRFREELQVDEY